MKRVGYLALLVTTFLACGPGAAPQEHAARDGSIFKNYQDLKWEKILPGLGESSPEICFLHMDPKTKATQLLIRTPKALHVKKHLRSIQR